MFKSKKLFFAVVSVLTVAGCAAAIGMINASRNIKAMNETVSEGMGILRKYYTVTPYDSNEYSDIKMKGIINFHTDQYRIEGLGNLSVMTTNMGIMQMVSFMITPFEKQMPLCTLDFMYIMGKRKSYVEFYDLVQDTSTESFREILDNLNRNIISKYEKIPELPHSENWYDKYLTIVAHKSLNNKNDELNKQLFCDSLEVYLKASETAIINTSDDMSEQLNVIEKYSNDLIEKGGVSTNVFKEELGEETTRDFFNKVFFGTDKYRE